MHPNVMCGGLVTDFGSVHEGLSEPAWKALQDAATAGLLDRTDVIETIDTRDRAANIAALASQGYEIIVTIGEGSADETIAAAQRFPNTRFIGVQQSLRDQPTAGNYASLVFHEEQSGFIAGALAGLVSETGRVAAVCESRFLDSIRGYCDGYAQGVEYTNPGAQVDIAFRTGSEELLFRDEEWGREAALQAVERGADVVFAVGGDTAEAALRAAASRGVLLIGAETDLHAAIPEIAPQLITSAILDVRTGVLGLIQDAVSGGFHPGEHAGGAALAPFRDMADQLTPDVLAQVSEITSGVQSGSIRVEVSQ